MSIDKRVEDVFVNGQLFLLHILQNGRRPINVSFLAVPRNQPLISHPIRLQPLVGQLLQDLGRIELVLILQIHT